MIQDLKTLREQKRLSQPELAILIGVSKRMVTYYESGTRRPRPEFANRIGVILGLSKDELWEMFYGRTMDDLLDKQDTLQEDHT